MAGFTFEAVITGSNSTNLRGITDFEVMEHGGQTYLYAGSRTLGSVGVLSIDDGAGATLTQEYSINGRVNSWGYPFGGLVVAPDQSHILAVPSVFGTHFENIDIEATGTLSTSTEFTFSGASTPLHDKVEVGQIGAQDYLFTAASGGSGVSVWQWTGTDTAQFVMTLEDSSNTSLELVQDIEIMSVGGKDFLITASASEDAIGLMDIASDGSISTSDVLNPLSSLWVTSPKVLETITISGEDYLIAGSESGSLALINVGEFGSLSVETIIRDDLLTRFDNVGAIDTFTYNGRAFIVAGGADDRVTLLEVLDNGRFAVHGITDGDVNWTTDNILAIEVVETDSEFQIFVTGQGAPGITQFSIDKTELATPISGGASGEALTGASGGDLIYGYAGDDTIDGGAGDDIIVGGAGADVITGGAGQDIFIAFGDDSRDVIMDFDPTQDVIELGEWSGVHSVSELDVTTTVDGAIIRFDDQSLEIKAGTSLSASDLNFGQIRFWDQTQVTYGTTSSGPSSGAMISGLGGVLGFGEIELARSDNGSLNIDASAIFGDGFSYFGNQYAGDQIWVNTNGSISFGSAFSGIPEEGDLAPIGDIIAPFWADIDTRIDGMGPESGRVWVDLDETNSTMTITWENVGSFGFEAEQTNFFQLQLIDKGGGDFDISIRYDRMDWYAAHPDGASTGLAQLSGARLPFGITIMEDVTGLSSENGNTGSEGIWLYESRDGTIDGLDTVTGDVLLGTDGNDSLLGSSDQDVLRGGDGDDTLDGGEGYDWIFGNAGDDLLIGGNGNDYIRGGAGHDSIVGGFGGDDILGELGRDTISGQGGDDTITGSGQADQIYAGSGSDFVNGGFGYDRLTGGLGADFFFHLGIADHGTDWIDDYSFAEGDTLIFAEADTEATVDEFLIQYASTPMAGDGAIDEMFITYIPTKQIIWALTDGAAQTQINIQLGHDIYQLM